MGSARGRVNAVSNAKRALHLQVETIASALGFKVACNKKHPNFHDYFSYCQKCGVITPRILKKLNRIRNAVEHEYYIPKADEVDDFIDVIDLFLAATDRFVNQLPDELEFLPGRKSRKDSPDISSIKLKTFEGIIQLVVYPEETFDASKESWEEYSSRCSLYIEAKDEKYFLWLEKLVKFEL